MTQTEILYAAGGLALILLGAFGHRRGWWSYALYFFFFSSAGVFLVGLAAASYFFPEITFSDQIWRALGYTLFSLFMLRIFWTRRVTAESQDKPKR